MTAGSNLLAQMQIVDYLCCKMMIDGRISRTADIYSRLDHSAQVESGQVMNGMYM